MNDDELAEKTAKKFLELFEKKMAESDVRTKPSVKSDGKKMSLTKNVRTLRDHLSRVQS